MHEYWCAKPEENHRVCPQKPLEEIFNLRGKIPSDDPILNWDM